MQARGKKGRRALCQPLAESSMARAPRRDGCGPTGDGKRLVCYSALTLGGLPRGHRSTEVDESRRTGGRTRKRFSADSGWGLSGPLAGLALFPRRPPPRPRHRGSPAAGQEVPSGSLAGPSTSPVPIFRLTWSPGRPWTLSTGFHSFVVIIRCSMGDPSRVLNQRSSCIRIAVRK